MKKFFNVGIVVMALIMLLSGCGKNFEDYLVERKWTCDYFADKVVIYDFEKDGTGFHMLGSAKSEFEWEINGDVISLKYEDTQADYTIIESDEMIELVRYDNYVITCKK